MAQASAARSVELRHAFWAILVLVVLAMAFYVGKKFEYWRYQLASRAQGRAIESAAPDKFPNASANELIETALAAEKRGDWADAIERMMAAKRKNLAIPGLLFRVGKISFDHGDLQNADAAFAQAIRFKENVAGANYHRGVIAVRRNDLTSALQYFEAATAAEPFISEMYYFWAEALRIAQHPREAIQRYEQAIQRSTSENDVALCHFKIRLARIEAADAAGLARDIATERATGPLSVDWLMTDAALQLHYGNVADAIARIQEARSRGQTPLFLTCAGDTVFLKASQSHPDIATALNTTAAAP